MDRPLDVAFFDMDHTLIDNDCDVSWKQFLVDEGIADEHERPTADRYWDLYCRGELPEGEFLAFQLRQFAGRTPDDMRPLLERHFEERVRPHIYPQAVEAIARAHAAGAPTVMLTATNRPVAEPLARHLGLGDMLATEIAMEHGRYTDRIVPPYCSREGKARVAEDWCRARGLSLDGAAYYGDSINDVPILEAVGRPVAVNPDEGLQRAARERGWRIERWALEG